MRKDHLLFVLLALLLFSVISYVALKLPEKGGTKVTSMAGNVQTKTIPTIPVKEDGSIDVVFCPREGCAKAFAGFIEKAEKSVQCALYDLNLESIITVMNTLSASGLDVQVIEDDENINHTKNANFQLKKDSEYSMMHNKFCIIDNTYVITGSMNPTVNDATKNNNNLVIIQSPTLAGLYAQEFNELWAGTFSGGKMSERKTIILPNVTLEVNFCPDDGCETKLLSLLRNANSSIRFMTFSFTLSNAKDILIEKYRAGLDVEGVFEKKQLSDWDIYDGLLLEGLPVMLDNNKYNLHHKVFVIDGSIIVTGSMNPTNNGVKHNDENLLVIYDREGSIAKKYLEEFELVYSK